ncbi:DUF1134 domain-containing protein [Sphingobium sufflavum]|uniref:DUF1134 domain-containing protein n=1 Tax=Sphingobium sufflavum TaxID=1129547 RepID=UPI001F2D3344|nr:DUF1134 domain-containing protein [Sphingobium sufflavum]MCE7794962.1 DUF1134 domain-containing protein [Sphingobium sufflavum]
MVRADRIFRTIGQGAVARALAVVALSLMALPGGGALAQVRTVDPNSAIDADLAPVPPAGDVTPPSSSAPVTGTGTGATYTPTPAPVDPATDSYTSSTNLPQSAATSGYQKDDVIAGAEGVFGKGAEGLAAMIEKILKDQGQPIGYIGGREASGAIIVGLRYGSGTLSHKIEGERKVYWTGPSVGFDVGGNASKVFVLVYNLFDTQQLFSRFPGAEGAAYVIGGFTATYLRKGDIVLIPIRLGVGWRLGINAGYMKFSEKGKILPF